ncbi:transmembrane domain-containing protein [Cryptosporidium canis]|uniref:Transmembrane domain-containing protein n=1 Tax=Cryptosporidium canis TaxID=195482 RepID=A0ABQ8PBN2_9CRYT|nr:transmembrane domain-containing protein [Cryptosporidium canis]
MEHLTLQPPRDVSFAGHPSLIGVVSNVVLALIYLVIGALSILQYLAALDSSACENAFETNGTKVRPYFLNVFSIGIVSRLVYIIIFLVINLVPKLIVSELLNKLHILRVFDLLISMVFLASYSIVIALWSSTLTEAEDSKLPTTTLLNTAMYIAGSGMLFVTILVSKWASSITNLLYILFGLIHLTFSYLWIYKGHSLLSQIKRRQNMHLDLQRGLISKNACLACNADSSASPDAAVSPVKHLGATECPSYGILCNDQIPIAQQCQLSSMAVTGSISSRSSSMPPFGLFMYNRVYYASISQLKRKIKILILVCPASMLVSSLYWMLRGFRVIGSNSSVPINTTWNALYIFLVETIPSIALMYGFWSNKGSLLGSKVFKNYNQDTMEENFRCYTQID